MIFVTVGTQLAFDRMVNSVDEWAKNTGQQVFAQTGPSTCVYKSIQYKDFLEPEDFDRYFNEASLVVAHAGMGSILTALSFGKPIIIMPRKADLGEHRNDHQMSTARRFQQQKGIQVAWNENELSALLTLSLESQASTGGQISSFAPDAFICQLRHLIQGTPAKTEVKP